MLDDSYLVMGPDGLSHAHGKVYFRDGHLAVSLTPLERGYWAQQKPVSLRLGHVLKYPYSFYNLLRGLDDPELRKRCVVEGDRFF
jgi:hypothetical protein